MNRFLFLVFSIITFNLYSQQVVTTIPVDPKGIQQSYNIVDEQTGNYIIFIKDRREFHGFFYNSNNELIGKANVPVLKDEYNHYLGHRFNNDGVKVFLKSPYDNDIAEIEFDFIKSTGASKVTKLDLKGEKFIQGINFKNNFFLLTIERGANYINVYEINDSELWTSNKIDFNSFRFVDEKGRRIDLYNALIETEGFNESVNSSKVEVSLPVALAIASKPVKIYRNDNIVSITLDKNAYVTYLLEIDLNNFSGKVNQIKKPLIEKGNRGNSSNSFKVDDVIYQIVSSRKQLEFQIFDLENEQIINKFSVSENDEINFRNTPIIQENGVYDDYREMEKTSKFLRKVSQGDIGISVYEQNNLKQINIGSNLEVPSGSPGFGFFMSGGLASTFFSPFSLAYQGYTNTRSVKIIGLFDKEYNHIEGEIQKNVFDNIQEFTEGLVDPKAETIFKVQENVYWGGYTDDKYGIVKFN